MIARSKLSQLLVKSLSSLSRYATNKSRSESDNRRWLKTITVRPTDESNSTSLETLSPIEESTLDPLQPGCTERQYAFLDSIKPPIKRSYNLAAYVNQSLTLQQLIKLGVSLYDIENTNLSAARKLISLDFERDCASHIRFLVDNGLRLRNLGRFLSEYPDIFSESVENLQIRLNYLESKGFTSDMVAHALNASSKIISLPVKSLDFKLGELQIEFNLPAASLRRVVVKHPEIIDLPVGQYKLVNFSLSQEFGFSRKEIVEMLEKQPKIVDILRPVLVSRIDFIHNEIGLDHATIVKFPKLISGPKMDIKYRAMYLKKLKRDQYNPSLPLYVTPKALYSISDEQFCAKYAKTSVEDYKLFIKSM